MTFPEKWERAEIGDLCDLINGKAFKPSDWARSGLPIIRIQNLNRSDAEFNFCNTEVDERFLVETGELLFAWSGTPGTSFGAHVWNGPLAVLNQHIFRVRFDETAIDRDFFKHAINSTLEELINKAHGGVGLAHVTKGKFEATRVPLPPLAEQRRIVAKLDALAARLARARAELDRVPVLAEKLRAQILEQAQNGSLTATWRSQAASTEGVGRYLDAVRMGRESHGRQGKRARSDVELIDLPETWLAISPDELAADDRYSIGIGPFGSNLVKGDYRAEGTRLIFVRDIRRQRFDHEGAVFVDDQKAQELAPHTVRNGDVLITKMGDPPGDCALYDGPDGAIITADCIKLRAHPALVDNRFLAIAIRFPNVQLQILAVTKGVAQQKISLDTFRRIGIPIPPLVEQKEIVAKVDAAFARADRLEAEATRARALLDRLKAAILAKAFRGELVPQDPADEPASVLLERIRAQRAAAPKPKRGRRAKEPANA